MTKRKRDDNTEQINVDNLKKLKITDKDDDNDIITVPSVSQRVQESHDVSVIDLTKLPDETIPDETTPVTIDLTQLPDSPVKTETPKKAKTPKPYLKVKRKPKTPGKKSSNPFAKKTEKLSNKTRKNSETQNRKKSHSKTTPSKSNPKNDPVTPGPDSETKTPASKTKPSKNESLVSKLENSKAKSPVHDIETSNSKDNCISRIESLTLESAPEIKTQAPESTSKPETSSSKSTKKRIRRCRRCGAEGCSKNRKTCPGKNLPKKLWFVGWFEDHYPETATNLHSVESFEVNWLGFDPKGKPWPNTWEPARQILNDTKTSPDLFKELLRYSSKAGLLKDKNQNNTEYSESEIEAITAKTYDRYKYWSTVVRPFSSKQNPKVPLKSKNIPR